ncbi:MAG: molecular chaperone HtpG [Rikenellaceae bacterium]|nr:molecular chaperone HtpG [Rikenellaceae bacterium]
MQSGKIGVTTENIFPIIKKFLYSDHEIFLRELVSNAVDATQKLKTLSAVGEFNGDLGDLTIHIELDAENKILKVKDHGIGMTKEDIEKYINQIAFSGAEAFLEKYKNQTGIIGHFGLGFYSSFMVASKVEIVTKSYKEGAVPVKWSCDGTPEYTINELEPSDKTDRGTDIILYLSDDSAEFADSARIKQLLEKYCKFLPVPIAFGKERQWKDGKYEDTDKDLIINNTEPLWIKRPGDLTDKEYLDFYHELYPLGENPLFNIHLNIDYPFNLTGVLYFPKIRSNIDLQRNKIQLYQNQVFVTDSVEGIVPEFLTLLHGVIDSPDIPLNVSRSYLQSDSNVKKISSYVTRKVADRLNEIFTAKREDYENKWDDLKVFIEYGIVTDQKFAEKATDFTLVKNIAGKYFTLPEYETSVKESQTDKNGDLIYLYTNDPQAQHAFVAAVRERGYDVLVMDGQLDQHFISWFESKNQNTRFVRVDSDIVDKLIVKGDSSSMALSSEQQDTLRPLFEAQLPSEEKVDYTVTFEAMSPNEVPVVITRNEFMRRMKDMSQMSGGISFYGAMPDNYNVVINGNHPLVLEALANTEKELGDSLKRMNQKINAAQSEVAAAQEKIGTDADKASEEARKEFDDAEEKLRKLQNDKNEKIRAIGLHSKLVKQIIDLALLSNGMLKGEDLTNFIRRSVELIGK